MGAPDPPPCFAPSPCYHAPFPPSPPRASPMPLAVAYGQDLDPLGNRFLSTLLAGLHGLVLFYLLRPRRWLASKAGAAGALVAILVAWLVYGMPFPMACWSFV